MVWALGNFLYFATIPGNILVAGKIWNRRWRLWEAHRCFFAYIAFAAMRTLVLCPWHLADRQDVYVELFTYSEPALMFLLLWAVGEVIGSRRLLLPFACAAFLVLGVEIAWGKHLLWEYGRAAALPWAYRFIATDRAIHAFAAVWLLLRILYRGGRLAIGLFLVAIFGAIVLDPAIVGTTHPARFFNCVGQLWAQWLWLREISETGDWSRQLGMRAVRTDCPRL